MVNDLFFIVVKPPPPLNLIQCLSLSPWYLPSEKNPPWEVNRSSRWYYQFPKQRFTTSIWPFVCGWYALRNSSIVPNFFHQVLHKWAKNWPVRCHSLWYPMQPNNLLRNRYAMWIASEIFLQGITWYISENRSTTKKIESLPSPVLGKPCTKSMLISV